MGVLVKHSCNVADPGKALPFGRRAAPGVCARCDELSAGAAPRAGWVRKRQSGAGDVRAHMASEAHRTRCGPVCTYGEW
jgi:hypothetical protein